jgi:hypothetical protein
MTIRAIILGYKSGINLIAAAELRRSSEAGALFEEGGGTSKVSAMPRTVTCALTSLSPTPLTPPSQKGPSVYSPGH